MGSERGPWGQGMGGVGGGGVRGRWWGYEGDISGIWGWVWGDMGDMGGRGYKGDIWRGVGRTSEGMRNGGEGIEGIWYQF